MAFTIGYINDCFRKEDKKMVNLISESKAKEVLHQYGVNQSVPLDPIQIAGQNKIDVKDAVFKSSDIAGILHKENGKTTIYVNSTDPDKRKRFTIAHELGHYFLHLNNKDDALVVEYRTINNNGNDEKEKEANSFAAALLMDEVLVKSLWNDLKSVQAIADIFQVSYEAMGYRLNNLGLI